MDRFARARGARTAVIAGALLLALFAGPAAGAVPCSQRVLEDWSDNGSINRLYDLRCYEQAIDTLPADLRDYTDAAEIIQRAQSRALRSVSGDIAGSDLQDAGDVQTAGASSLPIAVVIGGGAALAVVLAGGVAYLVRRRDGS